MVPAAQPSPHEKAWAGEVGAGRTGSPVAPERGMLVRACHRLIPLAHSHTCSSAHTCTHHLPDAHSHAHPARPGPGQPASHQPAPSPPHPPPPLDTEQGVGRGSHLQGPLGTQGMQAPAPAGQCSPAAADRSLLASLGVRGVSEVGVCAHPPTKLRRHLWATCRAAAASGLLGSVHPHDSFNKRPGRVPHGTHVP